MSEDGRELSCIMYWREGTWGIGRAIVLQGHCHPPSGAWLHGPGTKALLNEKLEIVERKR